MQTITPFLWFDGKAEDAAQFYVSIFQDARIVEVMRSSSAGHVMAVTFELAGRSYIAMNGGPQFSFTPAISLFIACETQDEVDDLWDKLGEGGTWQRCGWLQDRFGLSWQVVPRVLGTMLQDPDLARSARVMQAMMGMVKLDIAGLTQAYGS